jgi:hypothetical protein
MKKLNVTQWREFLQILIDHLRRSAPIPLQFPHTTFRLISEGCKEMVEIDGFVGDALNMQLIGITGIETWAEVLQILRKALKDESIGETGRVHVKISTNPDDWLGE